jgi:ABC-type Mn2+/Zn2+ transport system ATPase subunit
LDEPTTALDRAVISDLYALIDDLNRGGMTIVTVTHDMRAAIEKSSHILHVSPDSCLFLPTEQFKNTPAAKALLESGEQKEDALPYGEGGFRYTGGKP